jgi:heme-degrading monooxygenase HmoA
MSNLGLDAKPPVGGIFHVAGFAGGSLRVLDIWDSQQAFEKFQQDRLTAAVQKAGISSQPKVQFFPVHNLYAPNIETIRKSGASSMPLTV